MDELYRKRQGGLNIVIIDANLWYIVIDHLSALIVLPRWTSHRLATSSQYTFTNVEQ